ncbi:unnamed protein product [Cylicostephanus goldi]|uniref:Glycosyltransferase 2-like domain-containing protein n=1 Tax=Cylicostephanus goldi TaxID=71465 RepID=A0A3P7MFF9_CYLGO|nr:unnamed protein product [Cylicostephanus goldi]
MIIRIEFSLFISDRIALNRSLGDYRKPSCRIKTYRNVSELPTTSVIIVYHNEAYSTLLRTVQSVVDRSPRAVLAEVILVDDYSNRTFLKYPVLDEAVKIYPVPVKIIRTKQRVGLIRARLMGAQEAEGEVLTFLDSHCECTEGWLEPLLDRIRDDRTVYHTEKSSGLAKFLNSTAQTSTLALLNKPNSWHGLELCGISYNLSIV